MLVIGFEHQREPVGQSYGIRTDNVVCLGHAHLPVIRMTEIERQHLALCMESIGEAEGLSIRKPPLKSCARLDGGFTRKPGVLYVSTAREGYASEIYSGLTEALHVPRVAGFIDEGIQDDITDGASDILCISESIDHHAGAVCMSARQSQMNRRGHRNTSLFVGNVFLWNQIAGIVQPIHTPPQRAACGRYVGFDHPSAPQERPMLKA